jgi:two-component SAPR family response regulator
MAIYRLRSALCPQLIDLHQRKIYQINRDVVHLDYDVDRFLTIVDKQADDIEAVFEAIELYAGPYLPLTDLPWATNQRTLLEQRYQHALRLAASHCEKEGLFPDALTLYKRMTALDPFDEAAHAGTMRCLIALGNRAAAIAQYQSLRRTLNEELGLYPEATSEVEQLYVRILHAS